MFCKVFVKNTPFASKYFILEFKYMWVLMETKECFYENKFYFYAMDK